MSCPGWRCQPHLLASAASDDLSVRGEQSNVVTEARTGEG